MLIECQRTRHDRASGHPGPPGNGGGFALIATVSILVLLAVIAIGVLSLSTVSVRSTSADAHMAVARANARLGLMMALSELQKEAGDDRRITADGDIVPGANRPHLMGVWDSWSPRFRDNPRASGGTPGYDEQKIARFRRWMVSARDDAPLRERDWVKGEESTGDTVALFEESRDGFGIRGERVQVGTPGRTGDFAWAVAQEGTKAKLSVSGNRDALVDINDPLHAQPRPNPGLGVHYNHPDRDDWITAAAKLIGPRQVRLDDELRKGSESALGGAHFTTLSHGLQTNAADGGLKVDLSLGFEMPLADFEEERWDSEGQSFRNPFHASAETGFRVPPAYRQQRSLYAHAGSSTSSVTHAVNMSDWDTAIPEFHFPIYAAPTFHTLRSHYRIPHHIFETADGPTVFERDNDHVAVKLPTANDLKRKRMFQPPARYAAGEDTHTGIRPVLDRSLFIVSSYVSQANRVSYMFTPVVTMWNPYNVALEIEGAVTYIWIDIPFGIRADIFQRSVQVRSNRTHFSEMGWQFDPANPNSEGRPHGRSIDPYFYGAITHNGAPLGERGTNPTIRFEPGEVRLFVPASPEKILFNQAGSVRDRTVFMKPVERGDDWIRNLKGGIYVQKFPVNEREGVRMSFYSIRNAGDDYPFFIALEDATRAKGANPNQDDDRYRGILTADVLSRYFAFSGEGSQGEQFTTPIVRVTSLKRDPYPFAVMESYHRTALGPGSAAGTRRQSSDLVFTSNPRQGWMTDWISNRTVTRGDLLGTTGPQYQTRLTGLTGTVSSFLGGTRGRNTYYGASHSSSAGRSHLSFFEIPTTPMLSLAGFQHCDLSATTFAPAHQFGNSWASAYVKREQVTSQQRIGVDNKPPARMIDHSYLVNEALWDGFFFSGAAPTLEPGRVPDRKGARFWNEDSPAATVARDLEAVLAGFVEDGTAGSLRNPRMRFHQGHADPGSLVDALLQPEGCLKIAAHLLLDGAFNVNSTSKEAWMAVLASLRGAEFELANGRMTIADGTLQSRLQHPVGEANDVWHGFRDLTDEEVELLAEQLVEQVRARGPFLSLAEFVNRRVENGELGLTGALQAAIDATDINRNALQAPISTQKYHRDSKRNIVPADTGVGIPGYLTQADVLQSLAPMITVRSDTFTIRSYGASRDAGGRIRAEAVAEAVVQRVPEFVDPTESAYTPVESLNPVNQAFGRRFVVTSFRFLAGDESRPAGA